MRIRRVGVVGAGEMGSGIAALAASAGVPVLLLDLPADGDPDAAAKRGVANALRARPSAFMHQDRARLVETGNIHQHLGKLGDCDWVVEAIGERGAAKRALFERLEDVVHPEAVVSTTTSALPLGELVEERSEAFRNRFLGSHFFAPPRFVHLLELVPVGDTAPEAARSLEWFAGRILGKGIVLARDVPGYIANRIGVYELVQAARLAERFSLSIEQVDAVSGVLLGRSETAIFQAAKRFGVDVISHLTAALEDVDADATLPGWAAARLTTNTNESGFYRSGDDGQRSVLDWRTGQFVPLAEDDAGELAQIAGLPLAQRLTAALALEGSLGEFARALFALSMHYTVQSTPDIAFDIHSVDQAMEWGYGWEAGPFRQMDAVGLDRVAELFDEHGLDEPELMAAADTGFRKIADGTPSILTLAGRYAPRPEKPGALTLQALRDTGCTLDTNDHAALHNMRDGVMLLEFRSKLGIIGPEVLQMLADALARIDREGWSGLVIGHEASRVFSAGANLERVLAAARAGEWEMLDGMVREFQGATTSLRNAPFPVVVAPFGLTLGGGCELSLRANHVQAAGELYIGLVETGVGLIPAGGGTTELLFRFSEELAAFEGADPFLAIRRAFGLIAAAKTTSSALEAQKLGLLRRTDRVTMNRHRLLRDAKQRVLDLAQDYVPAPPRTLRTLGGDALGKLRAAIAARREADQISDHDATVAHELAVVLSGGEAPPRTVAEHELLDLERDAFLRLLGTRRTQERIAHMLETGEPLKN